MSIQKFSRKSQISTFDNYYFMRISRMWNSVSNTIIFNILKYYNIFQEGKLQHYALGQWLHTRYFELLGTHYDKDHFYIQSTNVDRTLMSAESNLAGMWAPTRDEIWNPSIPWQPVPVHTLPEEMDEILAAKRPCPAFDHELKRYMHTPEFRQLLKKYKPLFEYLTKWSGRKVDTLTGVNNLYNVLWIEELKNMT